jgi:hypothetical protein
MNWCGDSALDSDKYSVDAAILHDKQTCLRKVCLNSQWRLTKHRPKSLFDMLLRRGILQLGNGLSVDRVAAEAKTTFLEKAANPGLDLLGGRDPYTAAKGWVSLLETVLYGLSKTQIPVLHDPLPVKLTASIDYHFLSWADDSGQLHRFITVDQLDSDTLAREGHSWRTAGDICMARVPMVLHFIVIGRQQELGKFASAWSRIWRHPSPRLHVYKFAKPSGESWKAVYRTETDRSAAEWVEDAWSEGAILPLMQDILLEEPAEHIRLDTLSQITLEADASRRVVAEDWRSLPMSRGACDLFTPCVWQNCCYGYNTNQTVEIENIGLYTRRTVPVPTGG